MYKVDVRESVIKGLVMPEFKSFKEIKHLKKLTMSITQKIHGSNAHILIIPNESGELELHCASRKRFLYVHDDNYGFARYCEEHKEEIIEKLGVGRHDGEWAGLGINSGEGLEDKQFILFDFWRYTDMPLPPRMQVVPVLYHGEIDISKVDEAMNDLKTNGSKLCPGFMRPEGIVVTFGNVRYKKVFDAEETQWTKKKKSGNKGLNRKEYVDFTYLCQPIRLEKLLSKDERYIREYPQSLPQIVKDYVADLIKEEQIAGTEDEVKSIKKAAASQIFAFVRSQMND